MDESTEHHNTQLKGMIHHITYRNDANGYTVAVMYQNKEPLTVVGVMPFVAEGDQVLLSGTYVVHPTYGQQFKVTAFEKELPTGAAAILRYLSAGTVKGIGPSTARKIVERFGDQTLEVIGERYEELTLIKGINSEKALLIHENYRQQFSIRDILLLLGRFEIPPEEAVTVYKALGSQAAERLRVNPYLLCDASIGLPFEKAEDMAEAYGIESDASVRLTAGVEYVLRQNLNNGHTCLPVEKVTEVTARLLDVPAQTVERTIHTMTESFILQSCAVEGQPFVALPEQYAAEEYAAARLLSMDRYASQRMAISVAELDYIQTVLGVELDEKQRKAIIGAFENGVFILTGGPGTGKTTTLRAMIELFEYRGLEPLLAAPTGRAAKRMTELTGRNAQTLHRMLEMAFGEDGALHFTKNEQDPLQCDLLIIDECSMVDTLLFESVLRALPMGCKLVLVGDSDQLPSVSAGNLLNDLLVSDCFASVRLDKIFRQAESSAIVTTAHAMMNDEPISLERRDSDLFFIRRDNEQEVRDLVLDLCSDRLPDAYGFDKMGDVQVLCPSRRQATGSMALNEALQNRLNPKQKNQPELFFKGYYLRAGDKVMQIKNNYEIVWTKDNGETGCGMFNGDIGRVESVDRREGCVTVRFEDRTVRYGQEELGQLELAYAMTVHKSQGSEFDCVVVPLCDVPGKLCYRNLLYTAITRARKLLVLVGRPEVFFTMTANHKQILRYTLLRQFLKDDLCLMD